MLSGLLVGLDGSPDAASALDLALGWAGPRAAHVGGIAVVDEPGIRAPEPVPLGAAGFREARDEARLDEARERVEGFLDEFRRRCVGSGVSHVTLSPTGDPVEQLLLATQRFDLMVLGRQTYFHFETQDEPDSTLREVVKNSPRPVVAVPAGSAPAEGKPVIIGYDGSVQASRSLFGLVTFGLAASGLTHVVCVGPHHDPLSRWAETALEYLGAHGVTAEAHRERTDRPAGEVLLRRARELDGGLLVMGAYGQPSIREFFFGSTTRRLLDESPLPLFLDH